jgi:iron(III) transport system ATP-binding protein
VVLEGRASGGMVSCALGELEVRGGERTGAVQVMIRPEQIRLGASASGGAGGHGVTARVLSHSCYGPDTVVRLALGPAATSIEARTFDQDVPIAGELVEVSVVGSAFTYPAVHPGAPSLSGRRA